MRSQPQVRGLFADLGRGAVDEWQSRSWLGKCGYPIWLLDAYIAVLLALTALCLGRLLEPVLGGERHV